MKFRQFGQSKISEIGMGCWAIGGNAFGNSYGTTDDAESIRAIKKAVQLGCNFFDTADVYGHGHSEELLGLALASMRKKVFIATKAGGSYFYNDERWGHMNFTAEYLQFAIEQSLHRLRTSYIDVYQLHNPTLQMIKEGEVFKPLRKLQEQGKIKHVGVSVFTLDEGLAALDHVDSIQCVFNIIDPRNYEMMETAKRRGIAVIVREPLANGLLTGKYNTQSSFEKGDIRSRTPKEYMEGVAELASEIKKRFPMLTPAQVCLKYVLNFDCVTTVIPGAKTERQVEENLASSDIPRLTSDELAFFGS
ncbi:MAG: aldo/keto reductase [Candidatus Aenigmarchaeota archaeon]|nr:aldo/keto reductase [Candidatus Aenigmarchaeota archaeon]